MNASPDIRTKRKSRTAKLVLSALLSLFAVFYIIYHIALAFRGTTPLFTVTYASFDDTCVFSGCIFRDDIKLTSFTDGVPYLRYSDSEKLHANAEVADIYAPGADVAVQRLYSIDREIRILEKSALVASPSAEELEKSISQLKYRLSSALSCGDTGLVLSLSEEITELENKKDLMTSGRTDFSETLALLKEERASLILSLGVKASVVTCSSSGVFYSYSDGYEGILTTEVARRLSYSEYDAAVQQNKSISQYLQIGSVITDGEWLFLCKADEDKANKFTEGVQYKAVFPDNTCRDTLTVTLESKEKGDDGGALLKFSCNMIPKGFDMARFQRISVVAATYTGLKVPVGSVRYKDGRTCVYIFKKGLAELREIKAVFEQNGYFLVTQGDGTEMKQIDLNDLIILEDKDMYEGKIID